MNINEFDSLIRRPEVYLYHKPRPLRSQIVIFNTLFQKRVDYILT